MLDALDAPRLSGDVSLQPRMQPATPPPLPSPSRGAMGFPIKLVIGLALVWAIFFGTLVLFRVCGLIRPIVAPSSSMAPAIFTGDHIMMEGFTFLSREPRRGDIVAFKSDGIPSLPSDRIYMKRIAGEPGEHVRISAGKLFVNGKQVSLTNDMGKIVYDFPPNVAGISRRTDVTVPKGCYFVLGDNSTNSLDSRFIGCIPRGNILGRIAFCYWPPQRRGVVK